MQKFKGILYKLLFPHPAFVAVFAPLAFFSVIYSLALGLDSALAYASYALSAYALTLVCVRAPAMLRGIRTLQAENIYIRRYRADAVLRIQVSLYFSLALNLMHALLQLLSGFYHHSIWFYSLAGYYALLALMRYYLLQDAKRLRPGRRRLREWRRYRFCGAVLLAVNLFISVIITYIVTQNRGFAHHEIITITMAAFTFTTITMAIVNIIRYRKYKSPVMSAAKAVSLTSALMSLMSLETAMFAAFGGESPALRRIITTASGAAVCAVVVIMAIYMIIRSTREIKSISKRRNA